MTLSAPPSNSGGGQAERPGGFQVDDKLELIISRLLDPEISRVRALQDLVQHHGGAAIQRHLIGPIAHLAALLGETAKRANGRHIMLQRQLRSASGRQARLDDRRIGPVALQRFKSGIERLWIGDICRLYGDSRRSVGKRICSRKGFENGSGAL
jgi:hypothetical protein